MYNEFDVHYEEIVAALVEFCKKKEIPLNEQQIRKQLEEQAEISVLNLYDWCARLAITPKTMIAFNQNQEHSLTYQIQKVMMVENLGDFKAFSTALNSVYDNTNLPIVKSMLKRVVYKHFLYNNLRMVGSVESFASKFFGNNAQKFKYLKKSNK